MTGFVLRGKNKPRTYRKRAYKDYLALVRCRKPTAKKIRKATGKQLPHLCRNLESIEKQLQQGKSLAFAEPNRLIVIRKVYEQQKFMYDNHTHSVSDRIVIFSKPWVRSIVRGKAGKAVEFGAKLTATVFHCIAMFVAVLNLRKRIPSLPVFLKQHFLYFGLFLFFYSVGIN